jgi:hypothetical protein
MAEKGGPLVRVASAPNAAIAEMWKGLLDNEGIPALLRMAGPLTGYVTFASPHDLLVLAADAEAARQLLAAFNEDERDIVGADDSANDTADEER